MVETRKGPFIKLEMRSESHLIEVSNGFKKLKSIAACWKVPGLYSFFRTQFSTGHSINVY